MSEHDGGHGNKKGLNETDLAIICTVITLGAFIFGIFIGMNIN